MIRIVFITILFLSSNVFAANINLACSSNSTYYYNTKETITSNNTFLFYVRQKEQISGDNYYFDTSDFCGDYQMTVESDHIIGKCNYKNTLKQQVTTTMIIDRYSGDASILHEVEGKKDFLLWAECKKDEKLF